MGALKRKMRAFAFVAVFALFLICAISAEEITLEAEPSTLYPSNPAHPFFSPMMGGMGMGMGMGGMGGYGAMYSAFFMDPYLFNAFWTPQMMAMNTLGALNAGSVPTQHFQHPY
eukprot:c8397_g1_i2.p1 GENE.c8397_g1_i2~~c8397_g1_i2.p1  ORF type:complete len:114 (+),score=33.42 c8397_g1_i2:1-342(+)